MPARVIRGEIVKSKSLAQVSLEAELLFRNLIALSDDYGFYDGDAEIIAAHAYPRRRSVTPEMVEGWIQELATADGEAGPIELYWVDGQRYVRLLSWEKHRGKSARGSKSRWPQPSESAPEPAVTNDDDSSAGIRGDSRGFAGPLEDPPEESRSRGVEESRSREEDARASPKPRKWPRKKSKTPVPASLSESDYAEVASWAANRDPPLTPEQLEYGWGVFTAKARANGYAYVDHAQAFRNALGAAGEAWALKGYGTRPDGRAPTTAQVKQDALHDSSREALEIHRRRKQQDDPPSPLEIAPRGLSR